MRLLVGLGNPGDEFKKTRHNVGFDALDAVAKQIGTSRWKVFKGGLIAETGQGSTKAFLFKPQEYMNRSGESIRQVVDFYQIEAPDLCIITDDVYITPGSARIRHGGGDGGHNGWKSIGEHLTYINFWRVRIGMGLYEQHPEHRMHQPPLDEYVLGRLPLHEHKRVVQLIDKLTPNLVQWLERGELVEETLHI